MTLADSPVADRQDLMFLVADRDTKFLAVSAARDRSLIFDGQLDLRAPHWRLSIARRGNIRPQMLPPEGYLLHGDAVCLFSYAAHQCSWPEKCKYTIFVLRCCHFLFTCLPVCTHLLHGRFVSHARCFFLQLTHAEGTWAFALRAMPGGPATSCPSGELLVFGESSSFDSPVMTWDEWTDVPDVSASVLLGVLKAPRVSFPNFLLT